MSRTTRHRGFGRTYGTSRARSVARAVAHSVRNAHAFGGFFVRRGEAERAAIWAERVAAYNAAIAAYEVALARFHATGQADTPALCSCCGVLIAPSRPQPPAKPFPVSKRRRCGLDDVDAFHAHLEEEAQDAARDWDRAGRDGGPHRRHRPETGDGPSRGALRAKARAASRRLLLDPESEDSKAWQEIDGLERAFPYGWW